MVFDEMIGCGGRTDRQIAPPPYIRTPVFVCLCLSRLLRKWVSQISAKWVSGFSRHFLSKWVSFLAQAILGAALCPDIRKWVSESGTRLDFSMVGVALGAGAESLPHPHPHHAQGPNVA